MGAMDLGKILVQNSLAGMADSGQIGVTGQEQMVSDIDSSGEYILPVPLVPAQTQLLEAIISSHYSELLAYFSDEDNPDTARAERAMGSLKKMAENIQNVCVHPALLIDHYLPDNLLARSTPAALAYNSGTFHALGMLMRVFGDLTLHVGIVANAGRTTDLIEAFLFDKPVNCYRYSGRPLKEPKPRRKNVSTVYLVPSTLPMLTAAVNSPFDLLISVDDSFDLSGDYATGLRSQLRDPSIRKAMAPVITLVALNTIMHANLSNPQQGMLALASAVVLRDSAGEIPPDFQAVYEMNLVPLNTWFARPDNSWPLPRPTQLPQYSNRAVYESLMRTPAVVAIASDPSSSEDDPSNKRVKLENGVVASANDSFTEQLLISHQKYLTIIARQQEELDNFRESATRRENNLDDARAEILKLTIDEKKNRDTRDSNESRAIRYKTDLEAAREREVALKEKIESLEKIIAGKDIESLEKKYLEAQKSSELLKEEADAVNAKLKTQETMVEYLKTEFSQASQTIVELNANIETLKRESQEYKEQANGQFVRLRELAINSEIQAKDSTIAQLRADLENIKSAMAIADQERSISTRERTRYGNRSGQARSKANTAVSSPAP